uniref:Uncharacterized protein n=1 Tax=Rhizophagus irregularis (strain DAOM 181602 / DAOM 197198 / MUCL 43194) TaxID=747089 RepID=U9U4T4_RHIID
MYYFKIYQPKILTTLPQDISYIYEEPIEGLKRYSTYALSEERTGRITYIDLNYTFPPEAVCPINITYIPLGYNYIMIIYVKTNNGVKGKYGLIINYNSEIIK